MQPPSPEASSSELVEQIERLQSVIYQLRARVDALETERDRLREENQGLRKKVTHTQLVDGLLDTLDEVEGPPDSPSEAPAVATDLHRALPATCTFQTFFRVAEQEGLDTDDARQCLRNLLDRGRLTQEGSRLTKQAPVPDAD
jgi:predicted nuclease with TOPRIM domain